MAAPALPVRRVVALRQVPLLPMSTQLLPAAAPIRARVLDSLHPPICEIVRAIDRIQMAYDARDLERLLHAAQVTIEARDTYLEPFVQAAEEGRV